MEPRALRAECPHPAPALPARATGCRTGWRARAPLGLPLDPAPQRRLARAGFARYAGRLYPDAAEADLRVLTALFTWFFLVDDACDGPDGLTRRRSARCATVRWRCCGTARVAAPRASPARCADCWCRPGGSRAAGCRPVAARFADAVAHHLDGAPGRPPTKTAGGRPRAWPSTCGCVGRPRRRTSRTR